VRLFVWGHSRDRAQLFDRSPVPSGGSSITTDVLSLADVVNACQSARPSARRTSRLSNGGLRTIAKVTATLSGSVSQIASGVWLLMSFSSGIVISHGKVMSN
jgi:hypothetical protein